MLQDVMPEFDTDTSAIHDLRDLRYVDHQIDEVHLMWDKGKKKNEVNKIINCFEDYWESRLAA